MLCCGFLMERKIMKVTQGDIDETRKVVKNWKEKRRQLRLKGVTKQALTKDTNTKELLKAYGNNPSALHKKLNEMRKFTTSGKVYKTEGGVKLTDFVKREKNKEIRESRKYEEIKYNRVKYGFDQGIKDIRKHKVERLQVPIEKVERSKLGSLNFATTSPEKRVIAKSVAVQNFKSALEYGIGNSNVMEKDKNFMNRLNRRLDKLTDDEINDLLETNQTVKSIMNFYRGNDPKRKLEFSGKSIDEYLTDLDNDFPNIMNKYYRLRRQNAKL